MGIPFYQEAQHVARKFNLDLRRRHVLQKNHDKSERIPTAVMPSFANPKTRHFCSTRLRPSWAIRSHRRANTTDT